MITELKEDIKAKLAEAVELWANENLVGKPGVLANAMYFGLEREMLKKANEINALFGDPNEATADRFRR